jgi:hypothetical protein
MDFNEITEKIIIVHYEGEVGNFIADIFVERR